LTYNVDDSFPRLSKRMAATKKDAKLIGEGVKIISSRPNQPKMSEANKAIRDVVRKRSNAGKNMLRLGTALLITPDPVTSAAAIPLLVGGKILHARKDANVNEVYEELRKALKAISSTTWSSL
ncbi:MAG: hypothetical protein ACREBS_10320, partial [Nitrososphaerales archaeon]